MTINIADNNPRVSYSVSAGVTQTSFAVPFEFFDETDVLVYIDSTLKTITTDYTVTGGDGSTGTITMSVTGPATVALVRDVTIERSTDFPTAGPFSIQSLNVELDKQIAIDADLEDQIDRAVRSPIEEFTTMTLPDAATRADKILKFDTAGNVAVESASALVGGAVVGANFTNNTFTGNGSQTAFTTTVEAGSKNNAQVYIDGVYQLKSSFSVSGLTLTFTEAPPLNSQIEVIIGNALDTIAGDASNVDYNQGGTGAQTRTVESKLQEFVSVKDFGAIGDGVTDDTAAIQAAIDASQRVYIPEGVYVVNAATGLTLRQGSYILGDGLEATVIYPTAAAGSIFKRVSPSVDDSYVRSVILEKLSVVMNHPATANPANYEQIAFDFRSISRGVINQCYAGNYNRGGLRATRTEPADQTDAIQGYGAIFGTSNANYCGGEVCTVENSQFYGSKKAIVVDDATLDPLSTAYATTIINNDVQVCESGIVFEQQYNAGSYVVNNVIQAIKNARGSSATTYAYRMAGRDSYIRNKYIEVTVADCDYIVRLESTAKRNDVSLGLIGNDDSFIALISDNGGFGNHNKIEYAIPSTNRYVRLDGNVDAELGRDQARVIFAGSDGSIQGTDMRVASVTRNGTGDYTIAFDTNTFADANYTYSIDLQIDTSGSGGSATVRTQSAASLRIVTRNAADAAADPLRVSVRCG